MTFPLILAIYGCMGEERDDLRQLRLLWVLPLVALAACNDKPEHYYVFCEAKDGNGWSLINTESQNGYLMACTYQSPDRQQTYTTRCRDDGCD